jgi:lysophospholipase L1-like esterase
LTEGFDVAASFPGHRVANRGIASDRIVVGDRGVLHRITPELMAPNPSHVFLLIGINDLADEVDLGRVAVTYRAMVDALREQYPSARVVCQSLLPTRGRYAHLNGLVRDLNLRIRLIARDLGAEYLDLHAKLVDPNGQLNPLFSRDGVHLTPPAYWVWRREVDRVLGWAQRPRVRDVLVDAVAQAGSVVSVFTGPDDDERAENLPPPASARFA